MKSAEVERDKTDNSRVELILARSAMQITIADIVEYVSSSDEFPSGFIPFKSADNITKSKTVKHDLIGVLECSNAIDFRISKMSTAVNSEIEL